MILFSGNADTAALPLFCILLINLTRDKEALVGFSEEVAL